MQETAPELYEAVMSITFEGPLPPPALLREYDELHPGFAQKLLDLHIGSRKRLADLQQQSLDMLAADQDAERQQFRRGQYLAFFLTFILVLAGTVCILKGHDWAGATIITGTIASVILAFIYGRRGPKAGSPRDG